MTSLIPLIPLLPFAGFVVNSTMGKRLPKSISGGLASLVMVVSFLISAYLVWQLAQLAPEQRLMTNTIYRWMASGEFTLDVTFLIDPLSSVMLLVITGIGSLIHIYSTAYMHDEVDSEFARYFSYLNLFAAFMLVLVLGSSFPVLFVGWEGVGLCSYLLIGFWFKKKSAADAGKKAFVVNRIGDYAFLLGMFALFAMFGTLEVRGVAAKVAAMPPEAGFGLLSLATLLLFVGATGKSAQIPLYVWLPDAMEGPTPVSALIHAATMVTAGVYMIGRNAVLFSHTPETMHDRGDRRCRHRAHGRHHRAGAERHQARARVLDGVAARADVPGDGRRRLRRRHLPSLHARVLQGLPLPRVGRRDSRAARRAGHPQHGWPEEVPARHLLDLRHRLAGAGRRSAAGRLLQQGRTAVRRPSPGAIRSCGRSARSRRS